MVTAQQLAYMPLFSRLPADILNRLAETAEERTLPPGGLIFEEGHEGDAVYFVIKGQVLIRRLMDGPAGAQKVLAVISPGEFFGEMALFDNGQRSAGAVAHTEASIVKVDSGRFRELLAGDPKVAMPLYRTLVTTLVGRLRQTTREMLAVFDVGRTLVEETDPHRLAQRVLSLLRHGSMPEDVYGVFYFWNEFTEEYEPVAFEGPVPESVKGVRGKNDPLFSHMLIKRECVMSRHWPREEGVARDIREAWPDALSFLAAPVVGLRRIVGQVVFGSASRTDVFTSGHRQVVSGVCNLAAPAFENASLRSELDSRERFERKRSGF